MTERAHVPTPRCPFVIVAIIAMVWSTAGCSATEPSPPPPPPPPPLIPPEIIAWDAVPRVLDPAASESVRLLAWVAGDPTAVQFGLRETIRPVTMSRVVQMELSEGAIGLYEAHVASQDLIRAFTPARGANFIGVVKAVGVDARDTAMLPVNLVVAGGLGVPKITAIGESMQLSNYAVNLMRPIGLDALDQTAEWQSATTAIALEALDLDPDFVVLVPPAYRAGLGVWFFRHVRNSVLGTGVRLFDNTTGTAFQALRGTERLRGIVSVRDPARADLGNRHAVHEFAHAFAAYLSAVYGAGSGSHWPISELARGIMGYQRGAEQEQLEYRFERQVNGTYMMRRSTPTDVFNAMELYLLGLIPATERDSFLVFADPASLPLPGEGVQIVAPARYITLDTIVARLGPRVPSFPDAPLQFRATMIVVTSGRLLTPREMAWYDYVASRGEATERLLTLGLASSTEYAPWYVATGGRSQMITRVR